MLSHISILPRYKNIGLLIQVAFWLILGGAVSRLEYRYRTIYKDIGLVPGVCIRRFQAMKQAAVERRKTWRIGVRAARSLYFKRIGSEYSKADCVGTDLVGVMSPSRLPKKVITLPTKIVSFSDSK